MTSTSNSNIGRLCTNAFRKCVTGFRGGIFGNCVRNGRDGCGNGGGLGFNTGDMPQFCSVSNSNGGSLIINSLRCNVTIPVSDSCFPCHRGLRGRLSNFGSEKVCINMRTLSGRCTSDARSRERLRCRGGTFRSCKLP